MELKLKNDKVLHPNELIFDPKKLIALGRLYHTLVRRFPKKKSVQSLLTIFIEMVCA